MFTCCAHDLDQDTNFISEIRFFWKYMTIHLKNEHSIKEYSWIILIYLDLKIEVAFKMYQ